MRKLSCIPNDALLAVVRSALDGERNELVEFLRALGELDARRLYLHLGFSSLFRYYREGLDLSEDQTYRRVAGCRIGYRFPSVLSMLASGELHMSGLTKLAPDLNETNHADLIAAARGRSKEQIELMLADQFGRPRPRTSISPTSAHRSDGAWCKSVALNLRLLFQAHNQHAADLIYGRDFMEAKRRSSGSPAIDRPHYAADGGELERSRLASMRPARVATGFRNRKRKNMVVGGVKRVRNRWHGHWFELGDRAVVQDRMERPARGRKPRYTLGG